MQHGFIRWALLEQGLLQKNTNLQQILQIKVLPPSINVTPEFLSFQKLCGDWVLACLYNMKYLEIDMSLEEIKTDRENRLKNILKK